MCMFLLMSAAGCAKLAHLNELLTLQDLSNEQAAQAQYVEEKNAKFRELLKVFADGDLDVYIHRDMVLADFGEPVIKSKTERDGLDLQMWLYRYPVQLRGSEKIYFYFDKQGKTVAWKHVEPSNRERQDGPDQS